MMVNQCNLIPTIVTQLTESPLDLLNDLLAFENDENNNLIQILGIVKPLKSSQTSITSLIRGLFTKNKNLLKVLHQHIQYFENSTNVNDDKQVFKNFINDFILWLNDDILLLFEKYNNCLQQSDLTETNVNDTTYFNKPILHLSNYVSFINNSIQIIRNPYILEQLENFSNGCNEIVNNYIEFIETSKLNNINFNNVQLFGDLNNINKNNNTNVCSYFKLTQIVERTRSDKLIIENLQFNPLIELLLLDLNGSFASQQYNALAIIAIPNDNSSRSLMFPPFRINELSLTYSKSKCQIILRSIHYTKRASHYQPNSINNTIIIRCPNEDLLSAWIKKLSLIFPLEDPDSPINSTFLIKLSESDNDLKMTGLGIDMLSDSSQVDLTVSPSSQESNEISERNVKREFKELISSPTLNQDDQLPEPSLDFPSRSDSVLSIDAESFDMLNKPPQMMKYSNNSSPAASFKSAHSQPSSKEMNHKPSNPLEINDVPLHNIRSGVATKNEQINERPVSSSAEIEVDSVSDYKENVDPASSTIINQSINQSAPELNSGSKKQETQNNVYKLASGSAIDISNFGKNHNPSFSVHRGLNEMIETNERPKSKFFGMFKKPKAPTNNSLTSSPKVNNPFRPPSQNPKDLTINTSIPVVDSDSDTIPLSASSVTSGMSALLTISQDNSNYNRNGSNASFCQQKNVSASGSAFALPSSTSTYFFKPYKNNESSNSLIEEENLTVPQELKDIINDDSTIDFYMSPTSPKSMKISKWKPKYGKWEMLTVHETIFIKLVVNYDLRQSWMLVFKEEFDEKYNEIIDKPILILDIDQDTDITQSSALDVQISSNNCITNEVMLIMLRCFSNELTQSIVSNVKNVKGAIAPKKLLHKSSNSSIGNSRQTIASSVMDNGVTSKSSTMTSVSLKSSLSSNQVLKQQQPQQQLHQQPYISQLTRDFSMVSISSEDINNAAILNNPDNTKLLLLNNMTIRLQKKIDDSDNVTSPSSWKILSMYSLSIHVISDFFTGKNYYSFTLVNADDQNEEEDYGWLICEEDKLDRIERIGKAGLLINVSDDKLFMIECKGKREFKELYEVF